MLAAMVSGEFELTVGERRRRLALAAGDSRVATRARIVLACTEPGVVYSRLAGELGVSVMTVTNVRRRFAASRLGGLVDRPRPGRPKAEFTLTDQDRDQLRRWASRPTSSQALALRAKIVLVNHPGFGGGCDSTEGWSHAIEEVPA